MSEFKYYPDDIEVVKIAIVSLDGTTKGISPQVLAMRIQEDILTPYVFIEVDIADGIGLLQQFPIRGEEQLEIELRMPRTNASLKYKFATFSVVNLSVNAKNNTSFYTLKGMSEEVLVNASSIIGKAYKDTYSNVVRDIITSKLKTTKKVDAQTTLGSHEIVIPSMKPFHAIDMIRKRAVTSKAQYAPMVFFETNEGYVFKDMVSLYEEGVAAASKSQLTYSYTNVLMTDSTQAGTIISFTTGEKRDSFSQLNNGAFNNKITTYDIVTKTLKTYDFDYQSKKSQFKLYNDKNSHSDAFISKYGNSIARTYMIPVDSTKPEYFVDKVGDKQSYANIIFQNFSRVELNGNPAHKILQAGSVIYLALSNESVVYDRANNEPPLDRETSGYYLIKKLIHEVILTSGIPMYRISCDLISGSVLERT
jgi:hypothetical protein